MNKKLLIHLLDIAYPNAELPVDSAKIANLYKRFDTYADGITLCDDGKVLLHDSFICDLSKNESYLELALNEITNISTTFYVKIENVSQRYLLQVIRQLNKRGKVVSRVKALSKETYIYFDPIN